MKLPKVPILMASLACAAPMAAAEMPNAPTDGCYFEAQIVSQAPEQNSAYAVGKLKCGPNHASLSLEDERMLFIEFDTKMPDAVIGERFLMLDASSLEMTPVGYRNERPRVRRCISVAPKFGSIYCSYSIYDKNVFDRRYSRRRLEANTR